MKAGIWKWFFGVIAFMFVVGCGSSSSSSGTPVPYVGIGLKDGDKLTGGVEITLNSQVTDSNKSYITYLWQVNPLKGTLSAPTAATTKFTPPFVTKQEIVNISLKVCNDVTKQCNVAGANVYILPSSNTNNPPIISSISLASATLAGGSKNPITASVSDPDPGQVLSYTWSTDRGSFADTHALDTIYTAPVITQQNDIVNLTLTVGDGFTTISRTVAIAINNAPPAIQLISIQNSVDKNSTTDLTALVTPIGDTMTYLWAAQLGSFSSTKDLTTKYKAPSTAGVDTLKLTVCDARNSCTNQEKIVTVK